MKSYQNLRLREGTLIFMMIKIIYDILLVMINKRNQLNFEGSHYDNYDLL